MNKKQRRQFITKAKELLISFGATSSRDDFTLQTKAGKLTLFPTTNKTTGLGTVFTRFDDPAKALKFVPCNRFSSKWNHHFFDGWTVETAIEELAFQLKKVISKISSSSL